MGASFGMKKPYTIERDHPLTLRYLLHAHSDKYSHQVAERVHQAFAKRPTFEVSEATTKHNQYQVSRIESNRVADSTAE